MTKGIISVYSVIIILLSIFTTSTLASEQNDKTLSYAAYAFPLSLDPAYGTSVGDAMLKINLFEGLTTLDSTGQVVPGAAERWEVSEDGRQYTFYLREGLRWSDGSPLLAEHYANTVRRVHQGSGVKRPTYYYDLIENSTAILQNKKGIDTLGLEVVDERTLVFRLIQPAPFFPALLSIASLPSPPGLMNRVTDSDPLPAVASLPVSGAYQIADFQPKFQQYRLVKNPHYRNEESVYFDTVKYQLFDHANQALFALATGKIAVYDKYTGSQLAGLQNAPAVQVINIGSPSADYISLNMDDPILNDRRIRRALSLSLDRASLVQALGHADKKNTIATSLSPSMPAMGWQAMPSVWGSLSMVERRRQAQALLAEVGYGPAQRLKLEFLVNKGNDNERLAEQIRQQWRVIGVDVKVITNTTAVHYAHLTKHNYQLARVGWTADYPDPQNFLNQLGEKNPSNFGRWQHAEYTEVLEQLQTQALTPAKRLALMQQLETIIQQEVPVIPVFYKVSYALLSNQLAPVNQLGGAYLLLRHLKPLEP